MVAPLAFAAMFNLVCSGTVTGGDVPFRKTLSINLETKRWCEQPCRTPHKVAGQRDTEIVLEDVTSGQGAAKVTQRITVSRETGRYIEFTQTGNTARIARGLCSAAPYTPIPDTPVPKPR